MMYAAFPVKSTRIGQCRTATAKTGESRDSSAIAKPIPREPQLINSVWSWSDMIIL
jgi:hypothetical protein